MRNERKRHRWSRALRVVAALVSCLALSAGQRTLSQAQTLPTFPLRAAASSTTPPSSPSPTPVRNDGPSCLAATALLALGGQGCQPATPSPCESGTVGTAATARGKGCLPDPPPTCPSATLATTTGNGCLPTPPPCVSATLATASGNGCQPTPPQTCPSATLTITNGNNCPPTPPPQTCPAGTVPSADGQGCQPDPPPPCPPGTAPAADGQGCQPVPPPPCPTGTVRTADGQSCQPPPPPPCPSGTVPIGNGQGCQPIPPPCPVGTVPVAGGQGCQPIVPPQPFPPSGGTAPVGVICTDGSFVASLAACPHSSPPPTNPQPVRTAPPALAATVTISGQNPAKIGVHANQYLDLRHSVVIKLDPGVEATGGQASIGSVTVDGDRVVWNGFTMNAGDDASATLNLVAVGPMVASGSPSIQSVSIEALDQSGNPVVLFEPGGGPTVGQLVVACAAAGGQVAVDCKGSGSFSTPQFNVSGGWDFAWSFSSCPDSTSTLAVTVLNSDGSQMDSQTFSQPPSSGSGQQHYGTGGNLSIGVVSPCSWSVRALQD